MAPSGHGPSSRASAGVSTLESLDGSWEVVDRELPDWAIKLQTFNGPHQRTFVCVLGLSSQQARLNKLTAFFGVAFLAWAQESES